MARLQRVKRGGQVSFQITHVPPALGFKGRFLDVFAVSAISTVPVVPGSIPLGPGVTGTRNVARPGLDSFLSRALVGGESFCRRLRFDLRGRFRRVAVAHLPQKQPALFVVPALYEKSVSLSGHVYYVITGGQSAEVMRPSQDEYGQSVVRDLGNSQYVPAHRIRRACLPGQVEAQLNAHAVPQLVPAHDVVSALACDLVEQRV